MTPTTPTAPTAALEAQIENLQNELQRLKEGDPLDNEILLFQRDAHALADAARDLASSSSPFCRRASEAARVGSKGREPFVQITADVAAAQKMIVNLRARMQAFTLGAGL